MARTEVRGKQIKDSDITRDDINVTTSGKALPTITVSDIPYCKVNFIIEVN